MNVVIVFAKPGKKRSFYTGRRDDRDRPVIVTDPDEGLVYASYACAGNDFARHAMSIADRLGSFVGISPAETEREIIASRKRKVVA